MDVKPLNLFYEEPDPDRWFKYDHYPRGIIRRIIRGKSKPGGVMMVALNLMKGLDLIGYPYRFNDYTYIRENTNEIACIIGKPHLLFEKKWKNPIIFGAGIYSHPVDCPDLLQKCPNIKYVLVPGEWMRRMFEPYYGSRVLAWPAGIDTKTWKPNVSEKNKKTDFLIYDKIRWRRDTYSETLMTPLLAILRSKGLNYQVIRYGAYAPAMLKNAIDSCKAAIFLCEHETQGLAYQQILSANVPILAWDRAGYWQDPAYFPAIKYEPVSSVPYWDDGCGLKFTSASDFENQLDKFLTKQRGDQFRPRKYIVDHLSLQQCARGYLQIVKQAETYTHPC